MHNLICSWVVPEVIRENGGIPVRTRVGHSFIKQVMAETGAVFGGEHSGHYYFRENYRADSGLIAGRGRPGRAVGGRACRCRSCWRRSSATRTRARSTRASRTSTAKIEEIAAALADGRQDRLDGLTVEFDDWWCNVRASNTEPLLRLNVEARTPALLEEKTDEVLALIGSPAPAPSADAHAAGAPVRGEGWNDGC